MVSKRIIPCLDIDNGRVVKGTKFLDIKDAGDPVELAKKYEKDGADELVFLDITASSDKRNILKETVKNVAKEIFIPFTVGGGINSIEMIQEILDLGADKVSLNTAALHNPNLIKEASYHFGSQCIVIAADVKRKGVRSHPPFSKKTIYQSISSNSNSICDVYSHGGRKNLGLDALKWIQLCETLGAGEILLTSMDRDGTKNGYDCEFLSLIKQHVKIPVIASGGAGTTQHIVDVLHIVDAALLASILHFNTTTVQAIKLEVNQQGIKTRLINID